MKPYSDYVMNLHKPYEFVVKVANCDLTKKELDKVKSGLNVYVVENMSAVRRLPIQQHRDFLTMGPCEIMIFEVSLKYPTITPQIAQLVSQHLNITNGQVLVRTKLEEQNYETPPETHEEKNQSLLLNSKLESESVQHLVGDQRTDDLKKNLKTRSYIIAGRESPSAPVQSEPMGSLSPVGSKQNTIVMPKGK